MPLDLKVRLTPLPVRFLHSKISTVKTNSHKSLEELEGFLLLLDFKYHRFVEVRHLCFDTRVRNNQNLVFKINKRW